ncbi:MAG: UDP-diphosphatase, partial [Bacteroidetes bacterium]|nr:UDP-diphosphatase [Bacteroidota bacterium]
SFFLAVPTITAAALYKMLKNFDVIRGTDVNELLIGNAISFVVGMISIKFFIGLITRYGLKFFGYYRIILGITILVLMALGHKLEIAE